MNTPALEDVQAAAARIAGVAIRTPLLRSDALDDVTGAKVWMKAECLQRTGSFKFRGAWNRLSALTPDERREGVVAFSSGNHAQGVALAAKLLGIRATIVMPSDAPRIKAEATRGHGAEIVSYDRLSERREVIAAKIAAERGGVIVPSYDDPWIVAGQGTAGLEIAEDLPGVTTVLVPVGGGGLSAGVSAAVKQLVPTARVVGVEPAGAPKLTKAREAGEPVALSHTESIADGLLAVRIGTTTFAHHQAFIDQVVTVDDHHMIAAMRLLIDRAKVVAEPSGAITVAALMAGAVTLEPGERAVCVLSGGNIEWDGLRELLADG